MGKFVVEAVRNIYLQTTIVADSYEQACEIADNELITDDFNEVGGQFYIDTVYSTEPFKEEK